MYIYFKFVIYCELEIHMPFILGVKIMYVNA